MTPLRCRHMRTANRCGSVDPDENRCYYADYAYASPDRTGGGNTYAQIEDNPLVRFLALDLTNPDSVETVLSHIDHVMQYGEDEEPKEVCASFRTDMTCCYADDLFSIGFYRYLLHSIRITHGTLPAACRYGRWRLC